MQFYSFLMGTVLSISLFILLLINVIRLKNNKLSKNTLKITEKNKVKKLQMLDFKNKFKLI